LNKKSYIYIIVVLIFSTVGMVFASVGPSSAACSISVIVDAKTEWAKVDKIEKTAIFDAESVSENEISCTKMEQKFFEWQQNVLTYDKTDHKLVTNGNKIEVIKEEITGENGIERTLTACWKI
jgi:hypothetical protein